MKGRRLASSRLLEQLAQLANFSDRPLSYFVPLGFFLVLLRGRELTAPSPAPKSTIGKFVRPRLWSRVRDDLLESEVEHFGVGKESLKVESARKLDGILEDLQRRKPRQQALWCERKVVLCRRTSSNSRR